MPITATPNAIIIGAILATAGWVYTGRRARTLARKQHTINIMLKGNFDRDMRIAHQEVSPYFKNDKMKLPSSNSEAFAELLPHWRLVLNHYEFIAAGIRRGDLDEKLVVDAERGTILGAYEKSEAHIFGIRDNRRNQSIYEHLEWLYKRWEKKPPNRLICTIEWCKGSPFHGKRHQVRD